jgi:predicted permease
MRFWMDLRFALRTLRKSPGFALVAITSLALGIGANTAIFSLVDGIWTRPLAVPKPGDIVRIFGVTGQSAEEAFSWPEYRELKSAACFRGLVARGGRGVQLPNPDGSSELHTVNVVSEDFFEVLGVRAAVGRLFRPGGASQGPVVVLGNSFWKRRYGGDPSVVGRQITVERGPKKLMLSVVGVLPESFRDIDNGGDRDLWVPPQTWIALSGRHDLEARAFRWFDLLGRIHDGVAMSAASSQVKTIARRLEADWAQTNRGRTVRVVRDTDYRLRQAGAGGMVLLSVVLLVVLLCSVNVANLLLARGAARRKEIAVRLALGAGRGSLLRQFMTENLVLGAGGLVAGLAVGAAWIALLPALLVQPPAMHLATDFHLDWRVLGFSLSVSLFTMVLFGLSPAWNTAQTDLAPSLKGRRLRPGQWLAAGQIAISLALLVSTALLVASFRNTRTMDYGLGRKPLLLVWVGVPGSQAEGLYRDALRALRELPGVREVAFASRAPLSLSEGGMAKRVSFPGRPQQPPVEIKFNSISTGYLRAMGTALRRGRGFTEVDQTSGEPVAIVSETMARRYWPDQDPLGKTIRLEEEGEYRITGIAQDAPINSIGETPEPYLYLPYWRNPTTSMTFVVETPADPLALGKAAHAKLVSLSRQLEPLMITTEADLIRYSAGSYQMTAELVSALGFLAVLLTAVGVFGVVSYGVNRRTREIGIRMAVGAGRADIGRLILEEVGRLSAAGMLAGLPLAFAAAHFSSSMLFGVEPWNPLVFLAAGVLLGLVLLAAGAVPARRASRVEPTTALRYE